MITVPQRMAVRPSRVVGSFTNDKDVSDYDIECRLMPRTTPTPNDPRNVRCPDCGAVINAPCAAPVPAAGAHLGRILKASAEAERAVMA